MLTKPSLLNKLNIIVRHWFYPLKYNGTFTWIDRCMNQILYETNMRNQNNILEQKIILLYDSDEFCDTKIDL